MKGRFRLRSKLAAAIGVGVLASTAAVAIAATSGPTPANKAVASSSKMAVFAPGQNVELMRATLRTSKPEDLILQVSAECSILTQLVTGSTGQSTSSAEAQGQVRVWVEVDGKRVALQSVSQPPQDPQDQPAGDDTDKVTFCDRIYGRSVTDRENPLDGTDEINDYIRTKSANAFNWVRLNAGAGIHQVVVKADLTTSATGDPGTTAEAYVGNRSLVIEPTKLANDAVIGPSGS